ncbi:D-alanyl-D-alanine carboxypeptidase/D-alanyl-D-alanine-endopeptidase [Amaricoccus sp.]|uniref:D-alanyl-D-alanine carboxypeptidase/D-alanyl-D-alanine endopeptidase n=1 Tax=Amaricoccus sp. TaxID=1872485 RepID=UPI001B6C25AF|nr:D-alanyl-D-alanine carboxypeptidase/D-alanyl-D-alanine-endopeptidase [Amaricoccus sp.]MBP7243254.1 D-alanyl-D-alanine carboxypeptidase/D-alanyl-D-alanine-endopeptidase [Amaricoccus sp.]
MNAAPRPGLTRRAVLAGAAAVGLCGRTWAGAAEGIDAILARSRLGAVTGFAVADAASGAVIEACQGDMDRPPASAIKILTALYALDRLGAGHRFETRLAALGSVAGGRVGGDLALVGGGDPLLDTDALGDMVAEARAGGLVAVDGRLLAVAAPPPDLAEIEPDQPATAAYNPAISGLNLNFNRVFLAWEPGKAGPALRLSAPGNRFEATLASIGAEVADGGPPRLAVTPGREVWSFAARSVAGAGSIWLPVRAPARYAGETMRALAEQAGLALPAPEVTAATVAGETLVRRESQPLGPMLVDMLRYSTNLTAEVVGLAATRAGGGAPVGLAESGTAMADWARARYGLGPLALVNHSGLTARTAISAAQMARLLVAAAPGGLPAMLKERPLRDGDGNPMEIPGVRVVAKTGTLDFVSALAGYVEGPGERRRAFAIFAADLDARAAIAPEARDDPPGAGAFARRARAQEQALIRRWIALG